MSIKSLLKVSKREIERMAKKRLILAILFIIPVVICFVIAFTFKVGIPHDLPIGVLDLDNSTLSRGIVRMIDATPSCEVKYEVLNMEQGRRFITGGETYALVVIPKNFYRDILRGTYPKLAFYYNNQMLLIGGIVSKDVTTAVQTVLAGANVKVMMAKGLPKEVAVSQVNIINVDEHTRSNPYLNYSYFLFFASFAHTIQVLIAFLAIWSVGSEFKDGTTKEWIELADNSILAAVFGKLLPQSVCFMLVSFFIMAVYYFVYGAPFEGSVLFLIFSTLLYMLAYQTMGIMYVALTGNLRLSLSSGAFFTALGFTFAGMTYPTLAMSAFARGYSSILPIRPYLSILVDQTMRGIPPIYDMGYIFWLSALALFGMMFFPRLKKIAQDESYWYQL